MRNTRFEVSAAQQLAWRLLLKKTYTSCHREARGAVAIQKTKVNQKLDCFATLAMTARRAFSEAPR
jgi:hypothetical protein